MRFVEKILSLFLLFFVSATTLTNLSAQVNTNLIITPAYSPFFRDYAYGTKTLVTLTSFTNRQVYITASIEKDDNSISIKVKNSYKPPMPITLRANIPVTLTNLQLKNIYGNGSTNDLLLQGLTEREVIYNQALPEGNYNVCIHVFDYTNGTEVGQACRNIYIAYYEPPQIIAPNNGSIVLAKEPQFVMTNWTPAAPGVPGVNYRLKICKLINGLNPIDALNNNVQVVVDKGNITSTNFPLDLSSGIKLENGSNYVMQVTALAPTAFFKNGGKSEFVTFKYAKPVFTGEVITTPATGTKILSGKAEYFLWRKKANRGGVAKDSYEAEYYDLKNTRVKLIQVLAAVPVYRVKVISNGKGEGKGFDNNKLADQWKDSIPQMVDYGELKSFPMVYNEPVASKPETKDCGKIADAKLTDAGGRYSFDIKNYKPEVVSSFYVDKGEVNNDGKGQKVAWVKAFRIFVDNKYYYNDWKVYVPRSDMLFEQSTQVHAKQYDLRVTIPNAQTKEYYADKLIPSSGAYSDSGDYYLLKKKSLLSDELPVTKNTAQGSGDLITISQVKYYIVAKKTASVDKPFIFQDLFEDVQQNGEYYVYFKQKGRSLLFKPQKVSYKNASVSLSDMFALETDINNEKIHLEKLELTPYQSSVGITGKLRYFFSKDDGSVNENTGKELANVPVKLVGEWVIKPEGSTITYPTGGTKTFAAGTTDGDGKFDLSTGSISYLEFINLGSIDKQQTKANYTAKDGTVQQVSGKPYFVLRLQVQSPYYYSPDNDFLVQDGYNYEVGTLQALVREATVKLGKVLAANEDIASPAAGSFSNPLKKAGERVFLCVRPSYLPQGFPLNDPKMFSLTKKEITDGGAVFKVVDETISAEDGSFGFKHVVLEDPSYNLGSYFLFSETPVNSQDNYSSEGMKMLQSKIADADMEQKTCFNCSKTDFAKRYNFQKDYHTILREQNIYTYAQKPFITGIVYPESNYSFQPLAGAQVQMYDVPASVVDASIFGGDAGFYNFVNYSNKLSLESSQSTPTNGSFYFNINAADQSKTGRKVLVVSHWGFISRLILVNDGKQMLRGQRVSIPKITLKLPIPLTAEVRDAETNQLVKAKVVVGNYFSWAETVDEYGDVILANNSHIWGIKKQQLNLKSTNGNTQFIIYPAENNTYEKTSVYKTVNDNNGLFTFLVKRRKHHIFIKAGEAGSTSADKNIPVTATVLNLTPNIKSVSENTTDYNSQDKKVTIQQARLEFAHPASMFQVRIEAVNGGYVSKTVTIEDHGGIDNIFNYSLQPAKSLYVRVTTKSGSVSKAKVYLDELPDEAKTPQTQSDGSIMLTNVPAKGTYHLVITPESYSGLAGTTVELNMANLVTTKAAPLVVNLNEFDEFSLSSLLGFPMEVKKLESKNGKYYVTARLKVVKNDVFNVAENETRYVDIDKVEIKKSALTVKEGIFAKTAATIAGTEVYTSTGFKEISLFNDYAGSCYSLFGFTLKKVNDTAGTINSLVILSDKAFVGGLSFYNKGMAVPFLSTSKYNSNNTEPNAEIMAVFQSNGQIPASFNNGFKISNIGLGNFPYRLHNRYDSAEAIADGSTFDKNGLHLKTKLHTRIKQLMQQDLSIPVGLLNFTTSYGGINSGGEPFSIPMDQWKFAVSKWKISPEGFIAEQGTVQAGALNVPAKNVLIDYDRIDYGTYDVSKVTLGNIPFNLAPNTNVAFGFDGGYGDKGAWSLVMLPPANTQTLTSFKNLPDLAPADQIDIKTLSLYSNGDNNINLSEQTPNVTVYNVSKFHPGTAWFSPGSLNFRGALDLNIPKLSGLSASYDLKFVSAANGALSLNVDKTFDALSMTTNGVKLSFSGDAATQIFKPNLLQLKGTIKDQNPDIGYNYNVTLTKTSPDNTTITVDQNKPQQFAYTPTSGLNKITGSMSVISKNTAWNNFSFSGVPYGYEGVADKPLTFEVKGDLVANSQSVGVKNVAIDGLGSGGITYDMNLHAIVGNLHIDQQMPNYYMSGDVEMQLGGGKWYMFGAATLSDIQDAPVNSAKAGFFAGKGDITPNMQSVFKKFFYDEKLPDNFPVSNYLGVLSAFEAGLPVPIIPQINIPLKPVIHAELNHAIHCNYYTGLNFSNDKIGYDAGGQLYVYVHVGAGASVGIACVGADFSATSGGGMYGHMDVPIPNPALSPTEILKQMKQLLHDANIALTGDVFLKLTGSAYVGGGLCDSDCDGWFCESTSWSKTLKLRLAATAKKVAGTLDFDVEFKDLSFE